MYYSLLKSGNAHQDGHPFVCQLIPFIGFENTLVLPFVGMNIPLIRNRGVTLVELIIVLTIAGILGALAAPGLQKLVSSNRLSSQINDMLSDISLARSEAIKRNTNIKPTSSTSTGVCASTNGTSCSAGGNWANGWLVYYDDNGTISVLKVHEALTGGNTLSATRTQVSDNTTTSVDTVAYSNNGVLTSTAYTYKFTLCDPKRKQTRVIDITVVGQTSITSGTC